MAFLESILKHHHSLFTVSVTTTALLPTQLLLAFVVPLRFVKFFAGQAEVFSPPAAAGSVIFVCLCGEGE
jgi:hypothetical protein